MVYTGPSKGCLACLKRRVKCDEGKPQCQRCQKAGRECPGYRDPSRIKIRDMTATTINRFEYDRAASAGSKTREDGFFDQNYSQSVISLRTRVNEESLQFRNAQPNDDEERIDRAGVYSASNRRSMSPALGHYGNTTNPFAQRSTLQTALRTSPEQHAIAYLTNCYLNIEPQGMDPGYLHVLKLVLSRKDPGACLQSCLSTLALAAFSRRPVSRNATLNTQASYSVALKAVNDAIGVSGSIFDDELLASIVILALVECLISTKVTGYFNHLYGGITILKSRGKRKFHDELGAELFMLLRFELFRTSVIRYVEPQDKYSYGWVKLAMAIVDDPCLPAAQALTATSRQNRLSAVIHSTLNNLAGEGPSIGKPHTQLSVPPAFATDDVMNTVINKDSDLAGTMSKYLKTTARFFALQDVPGHPNQDFRPIPSDIYFSSDNTSTTPAFPSHMQSYKWKSREHANLVLSMLTSKLFGCNVAETFVQKATPRTAAKETMEYQEMADAAREAIDIIIGSVPYLCDQEADDGGSSLEDYMWLHNSVALMVVLESPFANLGQRDYANSILEYVATVKGIKMAEGCAEQYKHFRQDTTLVNTHGVGERAQLIT